MRLCRLPGLVALLPLAAGLVLAAGADSASDRNRAAALLDNGDVDRAIAIFQDRVRKDPASIPDGVNLGIALFHKGDLEGAEKALRAALQIEPRDLRAHYNLGLLLKRRGENEAAARELSSVAATDEGRRDAATQYNLGIVQKRLRKGDEALGAFKRAVEISPTHASAHFQIYNELVQRGDKPGAAAELELFKRLQKATPDFQKTEEYLERGRFTEIAAPGPATGPKRAPAEAVIRFEAVRDDTGRTAGGVAAAASERRSDKEPGGADTGKVAGESETGKPAGEREMGRVAGESGTAGSAGAIADFDGDGSLDIALADADGQVLIFRFSRTGSLGERLAAIPAQERVDLRRSDPPGTKETDPNPRGFAPRGEDLPVAEGGLAAHGGGFPEIAIAAGDVDNDGDPDLVVSTPRGLRLLINHLRDPRKGFVDATKESGLAGVAPASAALWFDADRDGDLDLALAPIRGEETPARLYLNAGLERGEARFVPAGPEAELPRGASALAAAGLFDSNDPDLVLARVDGGIALARNQRAGRFVPRTLVAPARGEVPAMTASRAGLGVEVLAEDLDDDGRNDLLVDAGGSLSVLWSEPDGSFSPPAAVAPGEEKGAVVVSVALLDADGDGDLDVAALLASPTGGSPRLAVLRNDGGRRFTPVEGAGVELPRGANRLIAADIDGNAGPDLVALAPSPARTVVLLNATKGANRFVRVRLAGLKSNRLGIGATIEARAGQLVVRRAADGLPVSIGIGTASRADAIRVVWPTGVSQDLIDVAPGIVRVDEKREFAGSCPFLYAWDGAGFRFVGEALSGAPVGFLRPDGSLETPRPVEHLRIPPDALAARGSVLSLRMTEEMRELTAVDRVRLVAVDHPAGVEVYGNERLTESPPAPFRYLALSDLRPPVAAAELALDGGADPSGSTNAAAVRPEPLSAVSSLDGTAPCGFGTLGARLEGLAAAHALVARFDAVPRCRPDERCDPGALALVIDGWVSWTTSDVSRALLQARLASTFSRFGLDEAGSEAGGIERGAEEPRTADRAGHAFEGRASAAFFAGRLLPDRPEPWGPALEVRRGGAASFDPDIGLPLGPSMVVPLPASALAGPVAANGGETGPAPEESREPASRSAEEKAPVEIRIGSSLAVYYDRLRLGRIVEVPLAVHELAPTAAVARFAGVSARRRHADAEPLRADYDERSPAGPFARLEGETTPPGDVLPLLADADGRFVVLGTGDELALEFDERDLPQPAAGLARTWFLVSTGYARDGDPNTAPLPWPTSSVPAAR